MIMKTKIETRFNTKKRMNIETRAKRMQDVDNLEYMGKEKEEDEKADGHVVIMLEGSID